MPRSPRGIPHVSVYKPKARSEPRHAWLIAYKATPDARRRTVETVSTDLEVTRAYAVKISQRLERQRLGLVTAEDLRAADAAARPIAAPLEDHAGPAKEYRKGHLEDYRDWLLSTGTTAKQAGEVYSRCLKVVRWCGLKALGDVVAETVQGAVADQQGEHGWANKTANDHLKSVRQFVRWCRRHKRLAGDPLEFLRLYPTAGFEQHVRRALARDELAELLAWVEAADPYGPARIPGADRARLYFAAAYTGLRKSELASLTPESFDLAGRPPLLTATVTVAAAHSKHRRTDVQPLRRDVADHLAPWLATRPKGKPVFTVPERAYLMLATDLAGARAAWVAKAPNAQQRALREASDFLKYVDGEGRVADFHSLRHTYGTILAEGADISVVRELMRHSDIRLTQRYLHPSMHNVLAALDGLPAVPAKPDQQQQQRATGTYAPGGAAGGVVTVERGAQRTAFPVVPGGSRSFPQALASAERDDGAGVAQMPDTAGGCGGKKGVGRIRSTEPKVAGSSPARCDPTSQVGGPTCEPPAAAPAAPAGPAFSAPLSATPGRTAAPPQPTPAGTQPADPAPAHAAAAAAPGAPPVDLDSLRQIHAQLTALLGGAAASPHPEPPDKDGAM